MEAVCTKELLFILSAKQQEDIAQLQYYEFYFHLVRPDFLDIPLVKNSLMDFWVVFFYEDVPVTHPENALIFLIRQYVVEHLQKQQQVMRLKSTTVGSFSKALYTAAVTLNVYLDFLQEVLAALPEKEVTFFWQQAKNKRPLFTEKAFAAQMYPRRLVYLETHMLNHLQQLIQEPRFIENVQKAVRLVNQVHLIERDIFFVELL